MITRTLFIIFIFLWNTTIWSQDLIVNSQFYGIEDGLSHRDVQCIHQDQQGFKWFGTKYGLNRFDGVNFKWFTKENHGLQSNEINHMVEDTKGRMWLFHTNSYFEKEVKSIDIFDPKTEKIESFSEAFNNQVPFSEKDIVCFNRDNAGNLIFISRQKQLLIYDGTFHSTPISLPAYKTVYDIQWSSDGLFWVALRTPLKENKHPDILIIAFDSQGNQIHQFVHSNKDVVFFYDWDEKKIRNYVVNRIGESNLNFFQISPQNQQHLDTFTSNIFHQKNLDTLLVTPLDRIKKQNQLFWVNFGNQLHIFDESDSIQIQGFEELKNIHDITNIFFDKIGHTWIATQHGIYQIRLKPNHFSKILQNHQDKQPPTRNMTVDNSGNLWVVEEAVHNLWKIHLKTGGVSQVNNSNTKENNLPFSYFVSLLKAKSGDLYYSNSIYLTKFDPHTLDYTTNIIAEQERDWGFVWALYEDEYGKIWYTTDRGDLGFWDGNQSNWLSPLDSAQSVNYIYHFLKDQTGKTWLASDGGLFVLNTQSGEILERYWSGGKGKYYLPFDNIYHIHKDEDGSFWLGTGGTGLIHWSQVSGWQQFTKTHGLSNNTIYAVYDDNFENLWLSSDYGIMRFNKITHQTQAFLEPDGITHNEFNRISHYKDADGTLFFGGLNGVTGFHPSDFHTDSLDVHPPLVITDYQQYDSDGDLILENKPKLFQNERIIIQPDDRFFKLEFALLTYNDSDKNQYAYKVEGVDKDWNYQKENTLRFSRLPYGEHILSIKGQASNGQWSKNELAIKISVLKPFYLKTSFLGFAVLLLFTGMNLYNRWRISNLKKRQRELEMEVARRTETIRQQAEELQSLEKLKSRFFANVSHELRTPLTLLLGPVNTLLKRGEIKSQNRSLLQFAQRNAKQLLKLINEILDLSKLESGKLKVNAEPISLYPFLKDLLSQFHSFAQSEGVRFAIEYHASKELHLLLDKDKVEKIIQNYLSNAMKFTPPKGQVLLLVDEIENQIKISVKDSGEGIHPNDLPYIFDRFYQSKQTDKLEKGGTGIGLSLCKELAELLGGKVWAESEFGKGSVFYFEFPKKVVDDLPLSDANFAPSPKSEYQPTKQELETENAEVVGGSSLIEVVDGHQQKSTIAQQQLATILLVEDNSDLREYIKVLLPEYKIITAENGKIAWEILTADGGRQTVDGAQTKNRQPSTVNHQPNLIISDLMMPVMNGFEFLEKVKSDDRWRHIPVIMLTAKVNVKAKLKALRIGVDDYLTKPFEEEELKTRIENLLKNYQERMELFSIEASEDKRPIIGQADAEWLSEVETLLEQFLPELNLTMERVAAKLFVSHRHLNRKLKSLTGLTASQYLQEMRLQKSKDFLLNGRYKTIKEVTYAVGFSNPRYFSRLFQKHFGTNPSDYLQ